jgi:hypothetical protein
VYLSSVIGEGNGRGCMKRRRRNLNIKHFDFEKSISETWRKNCVVTDGDERTLGYLYGRGDGHPILHHASLLN